MIGGSPDAVRRLDPLYAALAPGSEAAPRTEGRVGGGSAESGYLHCGPVGSGHFVKMVHNGIACGMMAAYAEGFSILKHANVGAIERSKDAETAALREPDAYRYVLPLADITELWRRGSVVSSWLLDLLADAMAADPALAAYVGRVPDSGEGRWTVLAAVEQGVPAPVQSAALFERFASRDQGGFANQVLSALRAQFGGHREA